MGWVASGGCYKFGMNGPCSGPLLFTRDSGHTWTDSGQVANRFAAVGDQAWVIPGGGRADPGAGFLARTDDGGATWRNFWQPAALVIRHFQFLDPRTGWMDTSVGFFKTIDGGMHWASDPLRLPVSPVSYPNAEPVFVSDTTAFAFGPANSTLSDRELLRTDDGGQTWRVVALPVSSVGWGAADLRQGRVFFADPRHGWVSLPTWCRASTNCPEVLLATTDGGTTWAPRQPGLPLQPGPDVQFDLTFGDSEHGAALGGYPPRMWLTRDGGQTWQTATPPGHVAYADARTLWVIGDHLDRSNDGGQTWTEEGLGSLRPTRIQFVNGSDGWLTVTQPGTFLVTHDGGHAWQLVWPQIDQSPTPARPQR
jgi:photosystem II stability/assembly factor-like uncharacterized protein